MGSNFASRASVPLSLDGPLGALMGFSLRPDAAVSGMASP